MVVELQCMGTEHVQIPANEKKGSPEMDFMSVSFLDNDSEHRLAAFLKYRPEPGEKFKPGALYQFAISGLGHVKEDRSSLYLRGRVVGAK